jgi:hypothetical protein
MGKLHIRPHVMRREKMLNLCAVLVPHFKNLRANGRAVLHQLLVRGPRFLWRHLSAEHRYSPQTGGDPPPAVRRRLLEQYYSEGQCGWSRLSGLERRFGEFGIHSLVEQSPDRSNRIMLQEQIRAMMSSAVSSPLFTFSTAVLNAKPSLGFESIKRLRSAIGSRLSYCFRSSSDTFKARASLGKISSEGNRLPSSMSERKGPEMPTFFAEPRTTRQPPARGRARLRLSRGRPANPRLEVGRSSA